MNNIRNFTIEELEQIILSLNEQKYRANQLFKWLHQNVILSIDEASNISKELKNKLSQLYDFSLPTIYKEYTSKIDETKKYLILLSDGNIIETVLMKYSFGYSICVSSQVGCNMGCKFCASTIGGVKRNLETYEILSQIYLVQKHNNIKISNIVIMGSGEPMLNFENVLRFINIINCECGQNIGMRNITISTCGIVQGINKLMELNIPINLALSLHAPNDEIRKEIMPIAKKYCLKDIMIAIKNYYDRTNRRITFEYCLIKDINDGFSNAKKLIEMLKKSFNGDKVDFNINLIPVNEVKESGLKRPDVNSINLFKNELTKHGLSVTIRRELGKDISGSCGQLRASVK